MEVENNEEELRIIENYGDPERDYAHPKTQLFFAWLASRGVARSDKVVAVVEISDLILRGDHREAGVSDEDAIDWITSHLLTIKSVHGPQALEWLRKASGDTTGSIFEVIENE